MNNKVANLDYNFVDVESFNHCENLTSEDPMNKCGGSEFQDIFPYGIDQILVEILEVAMQNLDDEEEDSIKRVKQSKCMFILVIICSLTMAMENLYIFLGEWVYRDFIFIPPTILMRLIILPIATYKICKNWTVIFRLFFMVDKVLLAVFLNYIGVMGFILTFIPYTPIYILYYCLTFLFPLVWFLYVGNFRVMIIYCNWSKWQVITYKATLMLGSTSYFVLGVYYLVGDLRFTNGLAPELDEKIQNILLIYINAGFQVFLEMLGRMDGVDGISGFRNNYRLKCDPEDMEMLLKGRQEVERIRTLKSIQSNTQNYIEPRKDIDPSESSEDSDLQNSRLLKKVQIQKIRTRLMSRKSSGIHNSYYGTKNKRESNYTNLQLDNIHNEDYIETSKFKNKVRPQQQFDPVLKLFQGFSDV